MKKILLTLITITFSFQSYAEDDLKIVTKEDHQVRLLKTVKLKENQYVYVTARDNGHVLGQKIIVQTRVSCNGKATDFSSLPILDSQSVCNMKPESITMNKAQTALAMYSKSANIEKYNDEIAGGKQPSKISCNEETEMLKFSLKNICG
jgi:hypothetical protein